MEKFRISNDLSIFWSITNKDGSPYSLSDKTVRLFVTHPRGRVDVTPDTTIQGNVICWLFRGSRQRYLGTYRITAEIQASPADRIIRKDIPEAFELVSSTRYEQTETGEPEINESGELTLATSLDIFQIMPIIPQVGPNGNWWVDGVDTGTSSVGPQGPAGEGGSTEPQIINVELSEEYVTAIKKGYLNHDGVLRDPIAPIMLQGNLEAGRYTKIVANGTEVLAEGHATAMSLDVGGMPMTTIVYPTEFMGEKLESFQFPLVLAMNGQIVIAYTGLPYDSEIKIKGNEIKTEDAAVLKKYFSLANRPLVKVTRVTNYSDGGSSIRGIYMTDSVLYKTQDHLSLESQDRSLFITYDSEGKIQRVINHDMTPEAVYKAISEGTSVDMDNYYTKKEVNDLIDEVVDNIPQGGGGSGGTVVVEGGIPIVESEEQLESLSLQAGSIASVAVNTQQEVSFKDLYRQTIEDFDSDSNTFINVEKFSKVSALSLQDLSAVGEFREMQVTLWSPPFVLYDADSIRLLIGTYKAEDTPFLYIVHISKGFETILFEGRIEDLTQDVIDHANTILASSEYFFFASLYDLNTGDLNLNITTDSDLDFLDTIVKPYLGEKKSVAYLKGWDELSPLAKKEDINKLWESKQDIQAVKEITTLMGSEIDIAPDSTAIIDDSYSEPYPYIRIHCLTPDKPVAHYYVHIHNVQELRDVSSIDGWPDLWENGEQITELDPLLYYLLEVVAIKTGVDEGYVFKIKLTHYTWPN